MARKLCSILLVVSIFFLPPLRAAYADGIYVPKIGSTAESADQMAIIIRQGESVTLTITTRYKGDGGEFAWIIPVPGKIGREDIWESGKEADYAFWWLDLVSSPDVYLLERQRQNALSAHSGGTFTEVISRFSTESYDIAIVSSYDPESLLKWLNENNFNTPPGAAEIFSHYIDKNFSFVAAKLLPIGDEEGIDGFPPAITIRYRSTKTVYPLKISSLSATGSSHIILYVISDTTCTGENIKTRELEYEDTVRDINEAEIELEEAIKRTTDNGLGMAVIYKDEVFAAGDKVKILWPEQQPVFYLTRLETIMSPDQMTDDIYLKWDPEPETFNVSIGLEEKSKPKLTTEEKAETIIRSTSAITFVVVMCLVLSEIGKHNK